MKIEQKNCLGLYLGHASATAVLLSAKSSKYIVSDIFSVSTNTEGQTQQQSLAGLLAEACTQRQLVFAEVAVAIDCAMFTQHSLRTQFTDRKQIAQTVKFDAEEAFTTDAATLAVTFNIIETDKDGSQLNVFAAQRKLLADVLLDMQDNNFDPVTMEPDVTALARFTPSRFVLARLAP